MYIKRDLLLEKLIRYRKKDIHIIKVSFDLKP